MTTATLTEQQDVQEQARQFIRDARARGERLNGGIVGDEFGLSDRWGRDRLREVRDERGKDERGKDERGKDERGKDERGAVRPGPASAALPAAVPRPPLRRRLASHFRKSRPAAEGAVSPSLAGKPNGKRSGKPTKQGARRSPRSDTMVVPWQLIAVAVAGVAMVTVVCAVVNYFHIRDLARTAGMGGLAGWIPIGVDGLLVAATASLIVDGLQKGHGSPLAWIGVTLGLAGSIAGNVLSVDPSLVDLRVVRWVLAGYAPAALAVSGHLLFRLVVDWLEQKRTS